MLHLIPARLADCGQGATVAAVTWEGEMDGPLMGAEQVNKEVVTVCRWVLGAEFAALPDYAGEAWNYHIREAGGEYNEALPGVLFNKAIPVVHRYSLSIAFWHAVCRAGTLIVLNIHV